MRFFSASAADAQSPARRDAAELKVFSSPLALLWREEMMRFVDVFFSRFNADAAAPSARLLRRVRSRRVR